jgi:ribosome-associated translation inhibitor RaiA
MSFRVSGKNLELGEALQDRIRSRVLDAVEKYFEGGGFSGHVTVSKEGFGFQKQLRRYHRKLSDHHADDDVPVADGAERPQR